MYSYVLNISILKCILTCWTYLFWNLFLRSEHSPPRVVRTEGFVHFVQLLLLKSKMIKFCRTEKPYFEFLHCDVLKSNCHFFVWPYTWCGWEAKVDLWAPKFFLSSLDFLELHEYQSLWRFHQNMESSKKLSFSCFLALLTHQGP